MKFSRLPNAGPTCALLLILAIGVWIRSLANVDSSLDLWADEAMWAVRFQRWGLTELAQRPIGYALLTKAMVAFSDSEFGWRSVSYLSSLATLALLPWLAPRLGLTKLFGFFLVLVAALNPREVALAKEFKPYCLELFLHSVLVYLLLGVARTERTENERRRSFNGLMIAAPLFLFFAYNVVFTYPVVYGVGWWFLTQRKERRLTNVYGASLLVAIVACGVSAVLLSSSIHSGMERAWGQKYGVFYLGSSLWGGLAWFIGKTADWLAFSITPMSMAIDAELCFYWSAVTLVAAAPVVLVLRRQYTLLAILGGPWLVTLIATLLGRWPYGPFRTNIFMAAYFVPMAALSLQHFAAKLPRPAWGALFVATWAILALPYQPDFFRSKEGRSSTQFRSRVSYEARMRELLSQLVVRQTESGASNGITIVADTPSANLAKFYLDRDRKHGGQHYSSLHRAKFIHVNRGNPVSHLRKIDAAIERRPDHAIWLLLTKHRGGDTAAEPILGHLAVREQPLQLGNHAAYRIH